MLWPAWLGIASPLKLSLWVVNRCATWTGAFRIWKRRATVRRWWVWLVALNAVSLAALVLLFVILHRFSVE